MPKTYRSFFEVGHTLHTDYSGVFEGNMDYRFGSGRSAVDERRSLLYGRLGLRDTSVVWIEAENGDKIVHTNSLEVPQSGKLHGPVSCDGLITTESGQGLGLFMADCIPMTVIAARVPLLGLIHVGRPGATKRIHTNAIHQIAGRYDVELDEIHIDLGPSIQADSYIFPELSKEIANDKRLMAFMEEQESTYHFDLPEMVTEELVDFGVPRQQISRSTEDTGRRIGTQRPRFFSHHRSWLTGEPEGRNGFVAVMRKQ